MKKILRVLCVGILSIGLLGGCGSNNNSLNEISKLKSELDRANEKIKELQKDIEIKNIDLELKANKQKLDNEKVTKSINAEINEIDKSLIYKENALSNPIWVIPKIINSSTEWDKSIMSDFSDKPILKEGFLNKPKKKKWVLQIINSGMKSIEDVKIQYSISTYKHNITFGEDKLDILGYTPWKYKEVFKEFTIPEIASKTCVDVDVFYIGTFPMAKLTVHEIYFNKNKVYEYVPFTVCYYDDEFDNLQDSQHLRQVLGICK